MEAWIPITVAAAAAQTVRFMLQRHLNATQLSAVGATFARFVYSAPLVALLLLGYAWGAGIVLPRAGTVFWLYAVLGGTTQVLATVCVVALFKERNFAVGITFKKTEVLQTAIVGFLLLGEGVSFIGGLALVLGFVAVLILSKKPDAVGGGLANWVWNRAAGLGLLSGVFFAISAVSYRAASLSLSDGSFALRAGFTLMMVTMLQTIGMSIWFAIRDRPQFIEVFRAWRIAALVGVTSMIGSFCWFAAFTLQNAAYVNALGQIELVFGIAASVIFFRERVSRRELTGIVLLLVSILVLGLATL